MLRRLVIFLIVAGLAVTTSAQTPPVSRDVTAVNLLQQSITAMGGAPSIAAITGCTTIATIQAVDATGATVSQKQAMWIFSGGEIKDQVTDSSTTHVLVSGHGNGKSSDLKQPIRRHVILAELPFHLPAYVLLNEFNNASFSIAYVGPVSVNGQSMLKVHLSNDSTPVSSVISYQDWFFDPNTYLPLRVEFRLPPNENAADYEVGAYNFSQFGPVSGLYTPMQIDFFVDGQLASHIAIVSHAFNPQVAASDFDSVAPEAN
jgi:hypothetical protein